MADLSQKEEFPNLNGITAPLKDFRRTELQEAKQSIRMKEENFESESCTPMDLFWDEDDNASSSKGKEQRMTMDTNIIGKDSENPTLSYPEDQKQTLEHENTIRDKEDKREMFPLLPSARLNLITRKSSKMYQFSAPKREKKGRRCGKEYDLISVDNIKPLIRKDGPKLFIAIGSGVYRSTVESVRN